MAESNLRPASSAPSPAGRHACWLPVSSIAPRLTSTLRSAIDPDVSRGADASRSPRGAARGRPRRRAAAERRSAPAEPAPSTPAFRSVRRQCGVVARLRAARSGSSLPRTDRGGRTGDGCGRRRAGARSALEEARELRPDSGDVARLSTRIAMLPTPAAAKRSRQRPALADVSRGQPAPGRRDAAHGRSTGFAPNLRASRPSANRGRRRQLSSTRRCPDRRAERSDSCVRERAATSGYIRESTADRRALSRSVTEVPLTPAPVWPTTAPATDREALVPRRKRQTTSCARRPRAPLGTMPVGAAGDSRRRNARRLRRRHAATTAVTRRPSLDVTSAQRDPRPSPASSACRRRLAEPWSLLGPAPLVHRRRLPQCRQPRPHRRRRRRHAVAALRRASAPRVIGESVLQQYAQRTTPLDAARSAPSGPRSTNGHWPRRSRISARRACRSTTAISA